MKKIQSTSILLFIFFLFPNFHYGQELFRNYTSLTYNENLSRNDEKELREIAKQEKQIAKFIRFGDWQLRTVPIVFHILHTDESQKIPLEQVEKQVEALNNHFSLAEMIENHPNDPDGVYAKRAVDTKIRFCLATQNEGEQPIEGIEYVETKITQWDWDNLEEIKKNKDGVNPANQNKFLNIWVAHLPDDNAGYAQMPNRKTSTDGIVIDYRYFGFTDHPQYGGAKTLTFLIAQYLGLYPLSGYHSERPCSDDYVADTPRSNSRNTGCPSADHVSLCDTRYVREMTMNFMSGTDDNCKYMFTRGQAARMQAVLDTMGARGNLADGKFDYCSTRTGTEKIEARTNLSASLTTEKLSVYPNPTDSQLFIEWQVENETTLTLEILSADGKLISSQQITPTPPIVQQTIDVSSWIPGLYLVKITSEKNTIVRKITIE